MVEAAVDPCGVVVLNMLDNLTFQEYHQSVKQFGVISGPTFCCPDLV